MQVSSGERSQGARGSGMLPATSPDHGEFIAHQKSIGARSRLTTSDAQRKETTMSMTQQESAQLEPAELEPWQETGDNWAESEWFQVWLQLARRDYHGKANVQNGRRPRQGVP